MNEKFLSRGKREDTEKWVEGYYAELPEDQHGRKLCLIIGLDGQYNCIIPETAGRCTGLTDKNGTSIFEGDIVEFYFYDKTRRNGKLVKVKNARTMLIEWCEGSFYMRELFRNYRLDKEMDVITETVYDYRGDRRQGVYKSNSSYFVEVVGNIHDNPELIEINRST